MVRAVSAGRFVEMNMSDLKELLRPLHHFGGRGPDHRRPFALPFPLRNRASRTAQVYNSVFEGLGSPKIEVPAKLEIAGCKPR
jgi:hypothetical protein